MTPLRFLTAGESHGPALTAILEGIPAGLRLGAAQLAGDLARRQSGYGAGPRMKIEQDEAQILSGVMEGMTTGAPIALQIANRDHEKWRGKAVEAFTAPRPGHADLTAAVKYGYSDLRPALERASARETAARVAVGAICRALLAEFGITVGGYVIAIGEIAADLRGMDYPQRIAAALQSDVCCADEAAAAQMRARIRRVMDERDTLGGVIEVVALGLPVGLGSHIQWDRRLDARLGAAILSIQAMKGVEIGPAFENARRVGTQAHDPIYLQGEEVVRADPTPGAGQWKTTVGEEPHPGPLQRKITVGEGEIHPGAGQWKTTVGEEPHPGPLQRKTVGEGETHPGAVQREDAVGEEPHPGPLQRKITVGEGEVEPRSGGLEGGITTGQPLVVRAAMKPIASTLTPQPSVDLANGQAAPTRYERSDFCPTPRAVVVVEAMVAYVLAEALLEKLGGDSLEEQRRRFQHLRRARLSDLKQAGGTHVFWPAES